MLMQGALNCASLWSPATARYYSVCLSCRRDISSTTSLHHPSISIYHFRAVTSSAPSCCIFLDTTATSPSSCPDSWLCCRSCFYLDTVTFGLTTAFPPHHTTTQHDCASHLLCNRILLRFATSTSHINHGRLDFSRRPGGLPGGTGSGAAELRVE